MTRIKRLLVALTIAVSCCFAKEITDIEALSSQPTRCTYQYAYEMYGAHCASLRLTKIPSLKTSIEILDFSDNKLRELHLDTLSSYSNIKFLYLTENQIYLIEDDALIYLTYLQTLDLSKNVLTELPNSILQLPSLRNLYLSGNPLIHMSSAYVTISKPIKAPLERLDLSDCKIMELPDWGLLPQLVFYNISHNPLITLDVKHFANVCNLKKIDLSESIMKIKLCDMRPVITWFQEKHIYFQLDDYTRLNSKEFEHCPHNEIFAIHNATHKRCKSEYLQVQNIRTSRRTWLTIGGGLAGFLVGFILLLYVMHRHNVAQTKSDKKTTPTQDGDKQAAAILLNDIS